jgi:hypothetical protein
MKKLIVLSVVFALVAATAFAVDIGANVFGLLVPAQGESGDGAASDDITSSVGFKRTRFSGYGEAGDGAFGGQIRLNAEATSMKDAFAFWKPIDQLKVLIGANDDGFYGKEGVTGWGFNGNPYDGGVAFGGSNIWGWGAGWPWDGLDANGDGTGGGNWNAYGHRGIKTRDAFYGGYGGNALHLNITPVDMFTINVAIPFGGKAEVADAFKEIMLQADVNLDFGNIALTFQAADEASQIFLYYGGSFGDLSVDFGFHYDMTEDAPMGIGLGLKYATDAFGVKFRAVASLGGGDKGTRVLADVLPYFPLGDNLVAFVGIGICMSADDDGNSAFDWSFNPYLRIGEEWGAQFLVGVDVHSEQDGNVTKWSIPIAVMVMF